MQNLETIGCGAAAGCIRTPHLAREKMYKTSGHLPYYAESMFPPMEMDEHRADRQKTEARITELEKQLSDHAKKLPVSNPYDGGLPCA